MSALAEPAVDTGLTCQRRRDARLFIGCTGGIRLNRHGTDIGYVLVQQHQGEHMTMLLRQALPPAMQDLIASTTAPAISDAVPDAWAGAVAQALLALAAPAPSGQKCMAEQIAESLMALTADRRQRQDDERLRERGLTARERQVARLAASGLSNKEIARTLGISPATTKSHMHSVLARLELTRRGQLSGCLAGLR
jgi:DNA-binding NarL/FixJ family response regulator